MLWLLFWCVISFWAGTVVVRLWHLRHPPVVASLPPPVLPSVPVTPPRPVPVLVRVCYQDEHGAEVGDETIDARQRRHTRQFAGGIFHADRCLPSGVWVYRRQAF